MAKPIVPVTGVDKKWKSFHVSSVQRGRQCQKYTQTDTNSRGNPIPLVLRQDEPLYFVIISSTLVWVLFVGSLLSFGGNELSIYMWHSRVEETVAAILTNYMRIVMPSLHLKHEI